MWLKIASPQLLYLSAHPTPRRPVQSHPYVFFVPHLNPPPPGRPAPPFLRFFFCVTHLSFSIVSSATTTPLPIRDFPSQDFHASPTPEMTQGMPLSVCDPFLCIFGRPPCFVCLRVVIGQPSAKESPRMFSFSYSFPPPLDSLDKILFSPADFIFRHLSVRPT